MSDTTQNHPKLMRRCQNCRRIIDTNLFDEHLQICKFRNQQPNAKAIIPQNTSTLDNVSNDNPQSTVKCRGCFVMIENTKLWLHFRYDSQLCMGEYYKSDVVSIFEVWLRKHATPKNLQLEIQMAFKITQNFKLYLSAREKQWCTTCGKSFDVNLLQEHLRKVSKCGKEYLIPSTTKCKFCISTYKYLLYHLEESQFCQELYTGQAAFAGEQSNESVEEDQQPPPVIDKEVVCLGCKNPFKLNTILKHLSHKAPCLEKYPRKDLKMLKKDCYSTKLLKSRLWNERRNGILSKQNSNEKSILDMFNETTKRKVEANVTLPRKKPICEMIICKGCKLSFPTNKILKHLGHKTECQTRYSQVAWSNLQQNCKKFTLDVKSYKKFEERVKSKCDEYLEKCDERMLQAYQSIKSKIEHWHLKCLGAIDLRKLLHYKWQINLLIVKRCKFLQDTIKLRNLETELDKKVVNLKKLIQETVLTIKRHTSHWCFDEKIKNVSARTFQDIKYIEEHFTNLFNEVLHQFNGELNTTLDRLKSYTEMYGIPINPYKFRHQFNWEFEKPWLKYENPEYVIPSHDEAKEIQTFVLRKVKNEINL